MKTLLIFFFWLQLHPTVPITLQVRYLDGSPFAQPIQIRNDEGEPLQQCQPDTQGHCTVELTRGLYLIEPRDTRLDAISAAAVVEIGGRWLAITVGDEPVEYAFVIDEGAVYFDAAPDAPRPQPIRPTQADLEAHFKNSETDELEEPESAETTPPPNSAQVEPSQQPTQIPPQLSTTNARQRLIRWFLFLLTITLGTVTVWWHTRRRQS